MSPQVTWKSNQDVRGGAPGAGAADVLVDVQGRPVGRAPVLAEAVRAPFRPSHGRVPDRMPPAPTGLLDLGPAAAFRVGGPDRESWLQGVQTGDVLAAPIGGAIAANFLGPRGRLVAEGLVWRAPDELVVTTSPDRFDALLTHCDRYLIMEDAELQRVEGLRRLRYFPGDAPPEVAGAHELTGSVQPLGFELLLPEDRAQELLRLLPERPAPEQVDAWRIALGVPAWGRELDEETNPLEAGLDRAISFSKGCYVGQEVVAMATFRGRVSWNLVRLQVSGDPPPAGTVIDPARGQKKNRVTSAVQVGDLALLLGYVHRELIKPDSTVQLEDGRTATVLGLPYESQPGAGVCA